jgi:phosphoglucosamine mutase
MGKLFGTDGIRGTANSYPIIPEVAVKIGEAVAALFKTIGERPLVIIGQDTRLSGDMLAYALASGVCAAGVDAELIGVLPTPGIALATRKLGASAGIVVSASHNPYQDNGIKVFGSDGFKLSDEKEAEIEGLVLDGKASGLKPRQPATGRICRNPGAAELYADFLKGCFAGKPGAGPACGLKIVLDCAHGATHEIAPRIFADLGCRVQAINVQPDGININHQCGSQHPDGLARQVAADHADLGLAFDGDGDRLIAVDDQGEVLSGDRVLAVCAQHLHMQARLKNNTVVSTVMSNVGLSRSLEKLGIRHLTTRVGDRYVMEGMRAAGASLGGEDSGHMIFAEQHTTGDGILSGLMLVQAIQAQAAPLSRLKTVMVPFPQTLINVAVKSKPDLEGFPKVRKAIQDVEARLGENGRVLVRYSGTESLCRVMVEGPDRADVDAFARSISQAIAAAVG